VPTEVVAANRGRRRWGLVGLASVVIVLLLAVATGIGYVADGLSNIRVGPVPLDPIAVPVESCPYLRPVRVIGARLDARWTHALAGTESWSSFRTYLGPELAEFESALTMAERHVPEPVARKFEVIVLDVRLGRAELPHQRSEADVLFPAGRESALLEGVHALNDASDLVGDACGARLTQRTVLTP
jgi:hypothetical protein